MSGPRLLAVMAILGAWLGYADSADAEHRLAITVSGVCPSCEAVMAAIADVLVDAAIIAAESGPALRIVVNDDGVSHRIEAGGASRTLVDPRIRCDEPEGRFRDQAERAQHRFLGSRDTPAPPGSIHPSRAPQVRPAP